MRHSPAFIVGSLSFLLFAAACSSPAGDDTLHLVQRASPAQGPPVRHASKLPVDSSKLLTGQLIYAPIYSELLFFDEKIEKLTAANLSIRNVSVLDSIRINFVDYYDDDGHLLRNFLTRPLTLGPLCSTTIIIDQSDRSAGAGANFLVEWTSDRPLIAPIVETITMQYIGQRALAFRSPSSVLREQRADASH